LRLRNRIRTDLITVTNRESFTTPAGDGGPLSSGSFFHDYEVFEDVVETRFGLMKKAFHRRIHVGTLQLPTAVYYPWLNKTWSFRSLSTPLTPWIYRPNQVMDAMMPGFEPFSGDLGEFGDEAFMAFFNQVPQEVSIVNFLWELREVKGLVPKLTRNLLKLVASTNLAFEFGIKPMIKDLQALANIVSSVEKRLQWLRSTRGRRVRIGFSKNVDLQTSPSIFRESQYAHGGSSSYLAFRPTGHRADIRAGGYLVHRLEGLDDAWSSAKVLASALGFNNPVGIVWEAIPYSFLIDWFTRVGSLIAKLAVQPFEGSWDVSDVTWSITRRCDFECWQEFEVSPFYLRGSGYCESYYREPGLPVTSALLSSGSLTTRQQGLALSLIAQRLR